jgi:hypothetical protein
MRVLPRHIPSVLTKAHHNHRRVREAHRHRLGIDHTYDLCWSCHLGLLHAGIISIKEVRAAAAATLAGTRNVTHDEVYQLIKADLAAGRRKPDWRALHGLRNGLEEPGGREDERVFEVSPADAETKYSAPQAAARAPVRRPRRNAKWGRKQRGFVE